MYKNEIRGKSWRVDTRLTVTEHKEIAISAEEQECLVSFLRQGTGGKPEVLIDCTHQPKITELAKSEFFYLQDVTVSSHNKNKGFILGVRGVMDPNGVTFRKKKPSEADLKKARALAKKNFGKR